MACKAEGNYYLVLYRKSVPVQVKASPSFPSSRHPGGGPRWELWSKSGRLSESQVLTCKHFWFIISLSPTAGKGGPLLILALKGAGTERSRDPRKITRLENGGAGMESCLASTSGSYHQTPGVEGWWEWAEEVSGVGTYGPN